MRDRSICKFSYSILLKKIKDWAYTERNSKIGFWLHLHLGRRLYRTYACICKK